MNWKNDLFIGCAVIIVSTLIIGTIIFFAFGPLLETYILNALGFDYGEIGMPLVTLIFSFIGGFLVYALVGAVPTQYALSGKQRQAYNLGIKKIEAHLTAYGFVISKKIGWFNGYRGFGSVYLYIDEVNKKWLSR